MAILNMILPAVSGITASNANRGTSLSANHTYIVAVIGHGGVSNSSTSKTIYQPTAYSITLTNNATYETITAGVYKVVTGSSSSTLTVTVTISNKAQQKRIAAYYFTIG